MFSLKLVCNVFGHHELNVVHHCNFVDEVFVECRCIDGSYPYIILEMTKPILKDEALKQNKELLNQYCLYDIRQGPMYD